MPNETSPHLIKANTYQSKIVRCNAFDEILREVPVSVAFYYKNALDADVLKRTLTQALDIFDIFSARLTYIKGQFSLDCNNQGVTFSTTQHEFEMNDIFKNQFSTQNNDLLFELINPKTLIKKQEAVLTVKVNYFKEGGMCLGMTWHHAVGDMQTFMSFMKAWSNLSAGKAIVSPVFVGDRHEHIANNLPKNENKDEAAVRKIGLIEGLKLLYYMKFKGEKQRWVQFYFTDKELKNMHQAYSQDADGFLSQNDVLSAHILSTLTETLPQNGKIQGRRLDMAINFRGRTKLDPNLMGNMVSTIKLACEPGDSPVALAKEIRNKVTHFADKHLDYYASLDYIENNGGRAKIAQFVPDWLNPYGNALLLTSWTNFGVYDIDFGVEKPFYFATMGPALFPWISSIFEGPNNQGLTYVASLPNSVTDEMVETTLLKKINQFRGPGEVIPVLARALACG